MKDDPEKIADISLHQRAAMQDEIERLQFEIERLQFEIETLNAKITGLQDEIVRWRALVRSRKGQ